MIQLIHRAVAHGGRAALVSEGRSYSYNELLDGSERVASGLLGQKHDLKEARIAFLVPSSFEYTLVQWGIWRAGGIAVPLCVLHPLSSLKYVLEDTQASVLVVHPDYEEFLRPLKSEIDLTFIKLEDLVLVSQVSLPDIDLGRRAMILYTSGTTSKPKGVVTTHKIIEAQITTLAEVWEWQKGDYILNVLPLHHVHGIINIMSCALWVGACCEFLPKFDAAQVWNIFKLGQVNLFMAVPTIYHKLIAFWDTASTTEKNELSHAVAKFRLMVSGSAALPVSVLEKWKNISGHILLERYGMTEIGMGLSNSYRGERRPGHVGLPLPAVELLLVDKDLKPVPNGTAGEILVRGPSVFKEYWQKPEATKQAFTKDGWFITGDTAILNDGMYKILGRNSVDIIKSGGYKISALQIEDALRKHRDINDCAVVGIPDEEWGEIIAAGIISPKKELDFDMIAGWLREHLPLYQIPRRFLLLDKLPRNVLGKVTKNALKKLFK